MERRLAARSEPGHERELLVDPAELAELECGLEHLDQGLLDLDDPELAVRRLERLERAGQGLLWTSPSPQQPGAKGQMEYSRLHVCRGLGFA